eukprot:CAMPEP_0184858906 /NCGR_PEP_ID=MMETSP0580-20130426/3937_1 /TAXON_ID=1118495 /ORGANISM="Dactyliosolen fragilissimus" /LENGTH=101 /DNA_ID=CAMNT_0027355263 /DNA_START=620 /DNA_END=925 /DNA_ORIENTATION=-
MTWMTWKTRALSSLYSGPVWGACTINSSMMDVNPEDVILFVANVSRAGGVTFSLITYESGIFLVPNLSLRCTGMASIAFITPKAFEMVGSVSGSSCSSTTR